MVNTAVVRVLPSAKGCICQMPETKLQIRFTTLGRSTPLYENIRQYPPAETAQRFGVQSKYSLESLSAQVADAYTTVSDITNEECAAFFPQPADVITINGFENGFVPQGDEREQRHQAAREKLLRVASALMQQGQSAADSDSELADKLIFVDQSRIDYQTDDHKEKLLIEKRGDIRKYLI